MTDEIDKAVVQKYKNTYPKWTGVNVTQTIPDTFGGTLAVIKAIDGDKDEIEEMCFIFDNGEVKIFQSTEQLAIFLDSRARIPWYQKVFATSTLSGIAFSLSIIMVFVAGFFHNYYDDKAFAVLGAVVGAAAGFYFGSSKLNR